MTGTRGHTSGTVIGDSATIDGGRSPPTVTSGTGEPSSLPPPSPSSPSDDDADDENSSPAPLENARTCLQLRDDCVISDVEDDTGHRANFSAVERQNTGPENEDRGLRDESEEVRPLVPVTDDRRQGCKPQRKSNDDEVSRR